MASGELSGKTAIITGGGRGLGRAMAFGLAHAGANVVVTAARTCHEIDAVADDYRHQFVASLWDSSLPPEQAAERARSMAGWTVPMP